MIGSNNYDETSVLINLDQLGQHRFLERGVYLRAVQTGLGDVAKISAGRRRVHILGIVHGQLGEVRAAVEAVHEHLYFANRLGLIGRVVVLAVADLRVLARRNFDLRQMVGGLGHIELRFVGVIEIRHFLVGDGNLGQNFAV